MLRKILLGLLAVLVIIQFIRPEKNQSAVVSANDITTKYAVPADVHAVLKRACFDCHSNNTTYPWYDNIQPVAWWLHHHIEEGKEELNFSEFATYSPKKARHKLEEVGEAVTEGWMPLGSYLWIHTDAKLKPEEAKLVADWAKGLEAQIQVPAGEEKEGKHHHEEH
ncbi:heme-binding domain-containing protein [Spirosoma foliorum]|uniref:Heme-binding domain-containing protein n=1 Tax=Spirosoma foliorum TaxID=2710596 RepID=A0A7G5GT25_9BACT|nr:heme-binding domain-containing protein [Spirosoma foliorum]QMW02017.1 heme-binding domain-containing protein [Spirosoma foliorum]